MSKKQTNYDRLDAALAHIDELTSIVRAQNYSITKLTSTIESQSDTIKLQRARIVELMRLIKTLQDEGLIESA